MTKMYVIVFIDDEYGHQDLRDEIAFSDRDKATKYIEKNIPDWRHPVILELEVQ